MRKPTITETPRIRNLVLKERRGAIEKGSVNSAEKVQKIQRGPWTPFWGDFERLKVDRKLGNQIGGRKRTMTNYERGEGALLVKKRTKHIRKVAIYALLTISSQGKETK